MNSPFELTHTDVFTDNIDEDEVRNTLALIQDYYNAPVIKLIDFYGHNNHQLIFASNKAEISRSLALIEASCSATTDIVYEDTCKVLSFKKEVTDNIRFYIQQPIFSNNNEVIGLLIMADTTAKYFDSNLKDQFNVFVNLLQSQMQLKKEHRDEKKPKKVNRFTKLSFFSLASVALLVALLVSLLVGGLLLTAKNEELKNKNQYQSQKLKMALFNAIERFDSQAFNLLEKDKLLSGYILSSRPINSKVMEEIVKVNNIDGLQHKAYAFINTTTGKIASWSRSNYDFLAYDLMSWVKPVNSKPFTTFSISDTTFIVHRLSSISPDLYTISAFDLNDFFQRVVGKLNTQDYFINLAANGKVLSQQGEVSLNTLEGAISASVKVFPSNWRIYVRPVKPIIPSVISQNYLLFVTVISLIVFCFVYYFLRLPRLLHTEIESKNKSIIRRELLFSNAVNVLPNGFAIFNNKDKPVINNQAYLKIFNGLKGVKYLSYQKLIEVGKQKKLITHYHVHHKLDGEHDRIIELGLNNGQWFTVLQRDMVDGSFVSYFHNDSESHHKQSVSADILEKSKQNALAQKHFITLVAKQLTKPSRYIKSQKSSAGFAEQKRLIDTVDMQIDCVLEQLNQFLNGSKEPKRLSVARFNFNDTIAAVINSVKPQSNGKLIYLDKTVSKTCFIESDENFYGQLLMHLLNQILPTAVHTIKIKAEVNEFGKNAYLNLDITYKSQIESQFFSEIKNTQQNVSDLINPALSFEYKFFRSLYSLLNGTSIEAFSDEFENFLYLRFLLEKSDLRVNHTNKNSYVPSILLVDDDPLIELLIKSMLRDQDIVIDYASNAIEALILLTQNNYSLILMDIMMPELSGMEALDKIKKYSLCNKTAIIAHTGCNVDNCYEHYISHGFDDVLVKPIRKGELLGAVRNFIVD